MMIQTAGGPGLVSPIDFAERRRAPLKPATWIAIGIVSAAHIGVGAALYYQRFEMEQQAALSPPDPKAFEVTMERPPLLRPEDTPVTPPAPNPPLNRTPLPTLPTETLVAPVSEGPVAPGPITITAPVPPEVATGVTAEPVAPRIAVITSPQWVSRPSAAQMMGAYPSRAIDRNASGSATLRCTVRVDGTLSGCASTGETPAGLGFGRAGVQLSRYFRMSPRTVDGQAVDGAVVTFNVRFQLTD